jgi:hypothetical protein
MGIHFETLLEVSLVLLVWTLLPEELPWFELETVFIDPGPLGEVMGQIATLLAMSLIAPFYVAGGFALYLNRRVELEAWDLELNFRRIAAQAEARRSGVRSFGGAALLSAALVLVWPADPLLADTTPEQAQQLIQEILAGEEFGKPEQVGYWRRIPEETEGARRAYRHAMVSSICWSGSARPSPSYGSCCCGCWRR